MRRTRTFAAAIVVLAALGTLTGCSAVQPFLHQTFPEQFGPYRGDDGRIAEDTNASARYLEVDDCFDFPDASDQTRVLIEPCTETHAFRVIATGEVNIQEQQTAGLQAAITQKCQDPFDAWSKTMPKDKRKDYAFLVRDGDGGSQAKVYTCYAALQKLN